MLGRLKKLNKIINETEKRIKCYLEKDGYVINTIFHYGAIDIDPKYLVVWIIVDTDNDKLGINTSGKYNQDFKDELSKNGYPEEAIKYVSIEAESQETINRDSNGDMWSHFK